MNCNQKTFPLSKLPKKLTKNPPQHHKNTCGQSKKLLESVLICVSICQTKVFIALRTQQTSVPFEYSDTHTKLNCFKIKIQGVRQYVSQLYTHNFLVFCSQLNVQNITRSSSKKKFFSHHPNGLNNFLTNVVSAHFTEHYTSVRRPETYIKHFMHVGLILKHEKSNKYTT